MLVTDLLAHSRHRKRAYILTTAMSMFSESPPNGAVHQVMLYYL